MDAAHSRIPHLETVTAVRIQQHILLLATVLITALSVPSCDREILDKSSGAELQVNLYIPDAVLTRAQTGEVSPLQAERTITTLHIWAFLHDDGTLVSYKDFSENLDQTGIPHTTTTRFGLPLTPEMFERLTTPLPSTEERPRVDVYAVANVTSAVSETVGEQTSRDQLDEMVVTGFSGRNGQITLSVPDAGLPMSGVLKNAAVDGNYPVLNISTIRLTRAVSKIRFVFCQQKRTATEDHETPTPVNSACKIIGIRFDGGADCALADTQLLFTTNTFDAGANPQYSPLDASFEGANGAPLLANDQIALADDPEELWFRSNGHGSESAEQYEIRLDQSIGAASQLGPMYLRETDKRISGTITYRTSDEGPDQEAHFALSQGDIFARNHSWIVYACFAEETMNLQLRTVVMPWEWTSYPIDFTGGSVNVIRRFTVSETSPATFTKKQTKDGFFDVSFWHTIDLGEGPVLNELEGDIIIATPVGAKLHIIPVPGSNGELVENAFSVTPSVAIIYPNYENPETGRIEDCRISIKIACNRDNLTAEQLAKLEGNYIDLHYCVEIGDGQRYIDLGSESIDDYRFILSENWEQNQNQNP